MSIPKEHLAQLKAAVGPSASTTSFVPKVGDVVIVQCTSKTISGTVAKGAKKGQPYSFLSSNVSIVNDVGGTISLPTGFYRVGITRVFVDHEIGHRCVGHLLDAQDVETARKHGISGFKPADYEKYADVNPDLVKKAADAAKNFDPSIVYFSGRDCKPTK